MKKADVLDDILDIFIRKAMEEITDLPANKELESGIAKQDSRRGDKIEVYASAGSR